MCVLPRADQPVRPHHTGPPSPGRRASEARGRPPSLANTVVAGRAPPGIRDPAAVLAPGLLRLRADPSLHLSRENAQPYSFPVCNPSVSLRFAPAQEPGLPCMASVGTRSVHMVTPPIAHAGSGDRKPHRLALSASLSSWVLPPPTVGSLRHRACHDCRYVNHFVLPLGRLGARWVFAIRQSHRVGGASFRTVRPTLGTLSA